MVTSRTEEGDVEHEGAGVGIAIREFDQGLGDLVENVRVPLGEVGVLDVDFDEVGEPSKQPSEERHDLADHVRVAELQDHLELAQCQGEACLLLVLGPFAQLSERRLLGAAVVFVNEVEEVETLEVANPGMPDGQLLTLGERGRRPARNRRLHAIFELAADRINVHGELRERTLQVLGKVVAVGGDEALEPRADDSLDSVFEQLAIAGGLDLDEVLELAGGDGIMEQRLGVCSELQHVSSGVGGLLVADEHLKSVLSAEPKLLLEGGQDGVLILLVLRVLLDLKVLLVLKGVELKRSLHRWGPGRGQLRNDEKETAGVQLVGVRGDGGNGGARGAEEVLEHARHDVVVVSLGLGEDMTRLIDGDHPLVAEEGDPLGRAGRLQLEGGGERMLRRQDEGVACKGRGDRLAELLGRVGGPQPWPRRVVAEVGELPIEGKEAVDDDVDRAAWLVVGVSAGVRKNNLRVVGRGAGAMARNKNGEGLVGIERVGIEVGRDGELLDDVESEG